MSASWPKTTPYGDLWDSSSHPANGKYGAPATVAYDLISYVENIIFSQKFKASCPRLNVKFGIVENSGFNGVAIKLGKHEERYLALIFSGAIFKTYDQFSQLQFINEIKSESAIFANRPTDEFVLFAQYIAMIYLSFHEIAHVFRGHLNYLPRKSEALNSLLEINAIPVGGSAQIRRRYLCECDADTVAGKLLGTELLEKAKFLEEAGFTAMGYKEIFSDLAFVATATLMVTFSLTEHWGAGKSHYYPVPPIRASIVVAQALQEAENIIDFPKAKAQMDKGLLAAHRFSQSVGLSKQAFNLRSEYAGWLSRDLPELQKFGRTLVPFSPCKK